MIKVKMIKTTADPRGVYMSGHVVELSHAEAQELVTCGAALFVDSQVQIDAAKLDESENKKDKKTKKKNK